MVENATSVRTFQFQKILFQLQKSYGTDEPTDGQT